VQPFSGEEKETDNSRPSRGIVKCSKNPPQNCLGEGESPQFLLRGLRKNGDSPRQLCEGF
jgi:hypothetical protein